jgi:hypothetical protein
LAHNEIGSVPAANIVKTEAAVSHFENVAGGRLTRMETYGYDPLEGYQQMQELRKERYYGIFGSDQDIFTAVIQKNHKVFENAICYFQNLTIDLSQRL